jgi:ankyrin repeat protein
MSSFVGVDVNALNLYGESALSTATYYNQILCVEYLLANKADPKLCAIFIYSL